METTTTIAGESFARIVSGSDDKTVRIWDAQSGQELRRLEGHDDWVLVVALSRDGDCIFS